MTRTLTTRRRHTATTIALPATRIEANLAAIRPVDGEALHRFVRRVFGLTVPRRAMIEGNQAPFDYLMHGFFEGEAGGDVVVWANRGGGKTMLGAAATLLDMLFKPGVQVRILGGSLEQSSRMFEHLLNLASAPAVAPLLAEAPTQRRVALVNGSRAQVLAQSERSVRGVRVHKLRCDEVELFRPEVWEAAQLVTRSGDCGGRPVRGAIEALSTMHESTGLMSQLTRRTDVRVLRWSAMDVIERCPPARPCSSCVLWDDCRGRAKQAAGFVPVDDLVAQWHRTSNRTWEAEMMCRRPSARSLVYPTFDPTEGGPHVMLEAADVNPSAERTMEAHASRPMQLIGGMDFGLRNPLVLLWARYWPGSDHSDARAGEGGGADGLTPAASDARRRPDPRLGLVEIIDEHYEKNLTLDQHLAQIEQGRRPRPAWIGVDPAGAARNSQTGVSDIHFLRARGYRIRAKRTGLRFGLDLVRRRFDRQTLRIHPRCAQLIHALRSYRYPAAHPGSENPIKDGPDHACDALRYLLVNLELGPEPVEVRRY